MYCSFAYFVSLRTMGYVSCLPAWRPYVTGDCGPIKILRLSFASCVDTKRKSYNYKS